MILFETERLIIKRLEVVDKTYFSELFTDQNVLRLIPQQPLSELQITDIFNKNLNLELSHLNTRKCICGIYIKENPELIGLSLFLINENDDKELGYRFREAYWGKGFGTETTKGMLKYYFENLKVKKVTADVNIDNIASVKVLEKFMKPVHEFFNEKDDCTDRRYEVKINGLQIS
ncbi:acetyltransferase, GNAT family [Formosa agariphila KMM 3901]|uniref:Acetyltransferase, GNAT family n=1 Tax=Formosa agariphila (strain DSM 15362 / KCTC 12365 / LMG 23005 / KMM 3901 / M-2Alg 35-1) TaxID=1347342 RepID=T2KKB7_FORAG|nr:GNAT family N-acetyltransferase [Formosa agariphila]CDF78888.1 acetyltransferase, GNAT family [Formosa agariphila KMM 3901]